MTKHHKELARLETFDERFDYLRLDGRVGEDTFGFDRYLNQDFYRSYEWRQIRRYVIARDNGCDLGVPGFEIHYRIYIHHMNPLTKEQIIHGDEAALDPDFLISCTLQTHNAIHYGRNRLRRLAPDRHPGDTKLW